MYKYNNNAKQRKDEKLFGGGGGGLGVGCFCSFHPQDRLKLGMK